MTYPEAEAAFASRPVELAQMYAFCGKALWSFEFNREPRLACAVLPFKDWDEFDAFFGTVPETLGHAELLAKAAAKYREAIEAAAPGTALCGSLWLELSSVADLAGGSAEECYAEAERIFAPLGDEERLGDVCMGRAHGARYGTYDMEACARLLREARAHFDRAGAARGSAHAAMRLAETLPPDMALYGEASDLFDRAGDKESAANALAAAIRAFREKGDAGMEEAAFGDCLLYIERNFTGEDLAKNYDAAAAFHASKGRSEVAASYRAKAAALRPAD